MRAAINSKELSDNPCPNLTLNVVKAPVQGVTLKGERSFGTLCQILVALFDPNGKGFLLGMFPVSKLFHEIPDWFGWEGRLKKREGRLKRGKGALKPTQCHGQGHSPAPGHSCCCWMHSPLVEESVVLHLRRIGEVFQDSIQQGLHPFVLQSTSHEDRGEGFLQRCPPDCQLENIPVNSSYSTALAFLGFSIPGAKSCSHSPLKTLSPQGFPRKPALQNSLQHKAKSDWELWA